MAAARLGEMLGAPRGSPAFIEFAGETLKGGDEVAAVISGAMPGLVGHDQHNSLAWRLSDALKWLGPQGRPHIVPIFIDEFDKAHRSLFEALMTFCETGVARSTDGTVADLKQARAKALLLLASNFAADELFHAADMEPADAEATVRGAMAAKGYAHHHQSRINRTIVFSRFTPEQLHEIEAEQVMLPATAAKELHTQ
jgi:ATP-dependent Clp protease ATP-binding subunit ClpA